MSHCLSLTCQHLGLFRCEKDYAGGRRSFIPL
jgi:hypothetical protein